VTDWQQQQQRDLEILQDDAMKALKHARDLGLSDEECMAIAYSAGIANDFYKEMRHV
jgi:hypothetical protein